MDENDQNFSEVEETVDAPKEATDAPGPSSVHYSLHERSLSVFQEAQERNAVVKLVSGSATEGGLEVNEHASSSLLKTAETSEVSVQRPNRGRRPKRTEIMFDLGDCLQYKYNVGYKVVDPTLRMKKSDRQICPLWADKMREFLSKTEPSLDGFAMKNKLNKLWCSLPSEEKNLWKQQAANDENASSVRNLQQQMRNDPESTSFFANGQSSTSQIACDSSSREFFTKAKVFVPIGSVPIMKTHDGSYILKQIGGTPNKYRIISSLKPIACANSLFKTEDRKDVTDN